MSRFIGRLGGRKAYKPTPEHRAKVKAMTAYGATADQVSRVLNIDPKTLRKYYRDELDVAHIEATLSVAQSLFGRATDVHNPSVDAQKFWLRTRGGPNWKEPAAEHHHTIGNDETFREFAGQMDSTASAKQSGATGPVDVDQASTTEPTDS